jgi:hypothetical protein
LTLLFPVNGAPLASTARADAWLSESVTLSHGLIPPVQVEEERMVHMSIEQGATGFRPIVPTCRGWGRGLHRLEGGARRTRIPVLTLLLTRLRRKRLIWDYAAFDRTLAHHLPPVLLNPLQQHRRNTGAMGVFRTRSVGSSTV